MNKIDLNILMLEDDPLDAELNIEQLKLLEEYNCIVNWVSNKENYLKILETSSTDLVLCDYNLPGYNGLEALNDLTKRNNLIPFIFVTGTMKEEVAADAIKNGAWDYVVKDRLFRLPLAVKSALKLKEEKKVAAFAEEKINKLIMAIEQTSAQIVVTDKAGKIEYVNKWFAEITGFQPQEAIGKDAFIYFPFDERFENNAKIIEKLNKGEVYRGEVLSKKKDGTKFWELVSITPIVNSRNEITNYVSVKEDITVRKEMEQDIIEARDKALRSDKLKEAFLQNMSHEIRTPLNAIVGFSDLLNGIEVLDKNIIKQYTSIINNSSRQLLSIVTDILTISRIQTGQENINLRSTDINFLFNHLCIIFTPLINEKKLKFSHSKHSIKKDLIINTDETKLTQILTNLLNNAIKFTHEGSIEFKCVLAGKNIEFYVKDTGIGINKEDQELIFDRFRQAGPSIHINYGGTGLGLSISKSFAQMLGGSIHVKSEPGKGSEFCLSIPCSAIKDKTKKNEQQRKTILNASLKILIAEDIMYNYILLETLLSNNKSTLYHAKNGLEAVNICRENPEIDIVLMDIRMPVMDGIKAFKEIRNIRKNLPVIALTAYASEINGQNLFETGFTDYLAKPLKEQDLFDKINKAVKK